MLSKASGAQVLGVTTHKQPKERTHKTQYGAFVRGGLWFALYFFGALLLAAIMLVLLVPRIFHTATRVALESPGKTFLVGFVASIVAPAVIVILLATVIGAPLGILALLSWALLLLLSGPFAAYYAGRLLIRESRNAIAIMALGAAVLLLLYFVPFLGFVVSLVAMWFGLGIILSQIQHLPRPHYTMAAEAKANKS